MQRTGVSAVTAYTAHREWATRPPDERFASVSALYEAARVRRARTEERTIETHQVRTAAETDDDLVVREASGHTAPLTHWSFEQLAAIAGAPPKYLRTLPASIASSAINVGLERQQREGHQLFADREAPWTVHAITSPRYARVHHDELASRVLDLMADGEKERVRQETGPCRNEALVIKRPESDASGDGSEKQKGADQILTIEPAMSAA